MNIKTDNNKSAFTLVELAIVLIIIGLITGGVVGAQSLIESAERNSVITDVNKISVAVNAFRLEYDALPGDFDEAEDYWGSSNTGNGNGNKYVQNVHPFYEEIYFWSHLSLAELVNQDFEYPSQFSYDPNEPERTFLKGSIENTFWVIGMFINHSSWQEVSINRVMSIALVTPGNSTNHGGVNKRPSLTVKQTYAIDKKIDDGKPMYGNMAAMGPNNNNTGLAGGGFTATSCSRNISGGTNIDRIYNLSNKGVSCAPVFVFQKTQGNLAGMF